MQAVFLDRDGTIIRSVDNLRDTQSLRLLPGVVDAIKRFNQHGFLVIVITNQPVIARGWLTEEGVEQIHKELDRRLIKKGAKIDAIYYCPHHPDANLQKYRLDCECRKPNTGMIKQAAKEFNIDMSSSFLVGDSTRDILAGKNAKLHTILVKTGFGGKDKIYDVSPDATAKNLFEAAELITKWQPR